MLLEVCAAKAGYGASQALFGVDLTVDESQVVSLMGRNGMGKTTTVRSIMGLLPLSGGDIRFAGQSIRGMRDFNVARLGLGIVPEGREIFPTLTVRENLMATATNRLSVDRPWTLGRVEEMFPILKERTNQKASVLSGGEQQMLAIGRALMTNPRLLILDEATEGLAPLVREEVWRCLWKLRELGQSILMIDKNVESLKALADRHYLMEKGQIVWSGTTADFERDAAIVDRHLHI